MQCWFHGGEDQVLPWQQHPEGQNWQDLGQVCPSYQPSYLSYCFQAMNASSLLGLHCLAATFLGILKRLTHGFRSQMYLRELCVAALTVDWRLESGSKSCHHWTTWWRQHLRCALPRLKVGIDYLQSLISAHTWLQYICFSWEGPQIVLEVRTMRLNFIVNPALYPFENLLQAMQVSALLILWPDNDACVNSTRFVRSAQNA